MSLLKDFLKISRMNLQWEIASSTKPNQQLSNWSTMAIRLLNLNGIKAIKMISNSILKLVI